MNVIDHLEGREYVEKQSPKFNSSVILLIPEPNREWVSQGPLKEVATHIGNILKKVVCQSSIWNTAESSS